MNRRAFTSGAGALLACGCGQDQRVARRYRFSFAVTSDGRQLGDSTVLEDALYPAPFPMTGVAAARRGDAIVLELAPDRLLVPLLAALRIPDPERGQGFDKPRGRWGDQTTGVLLAQLYDIKQERGESPLDHSRRLAAARGLHKVPIADLPDLVTFDDPADPRTVRFVQPERLSSEFGMDVRIVEATIEIVDPRTPMPTGIEAKLPWLKELRGRYLANFGTNESISRGNSPAETIHGGYFQFWGLRR